MLNQFFHRVVAEMHSDYFIPRIVRLFSNGRFPCVTELEAASIYDMTVRDHRTVAWCYNGVEDGYVLCEPHVIRSLENTKLSSLSSNIYFNLIY
jgi:hypothetical protein